MENRCEYTWRDSRSGCTAVCTRAAEHEGEHSDHCTAMVLSRPVLHVNVPGCRGNSRR